MGVCSPQLCGWLTTTRNEAAAAGVRQQARRGGAAGGIRGRHSLLNVQFVYAVTQKAVRARGCGRSCLWSRPSPAPCLGCHGRAWLPHQSIDGAASDLGAAWRSAPPPLGRRRRPRAPSLCCWRRPCASPSTPSARAAGWRSLCCAHPCSRGSMQHMAADAASSSQQTRPIQRRR